MGDLRGSTAAWTVLASPVMVAAMNIGTVEAPEFERDLWVGYPEARERLLSALDTLADSEPVVVSGDWHAAFVTNAGDEDRPIPEFVGPAISSVPFPDDPSAANPAVEYFSADNGFVVFDVGRAEIRAEFWSLDDRWKPRPTFTRDAFVVRHGERKARRE